MRKRDYDDFLPGFANNHRIWKAPQNKAFDATTRRNTRHGRQRDNIFHDDIQRGIDGFMKLRAQTSALLFIPRHGLDSLVGSRR